ncbi:MAG TPA: aldo/keto reductase [Nitriliruptoraceae bacterium]|nr:aldo/keto reductase [Nitriliruptoraceae bacterium]
MDTRSLYAGGPDVSEVGFGAWAIGGSWGEVDDDESLAALETAVRAGVTFFDTADVYGDGHSERLVGEIAAEHDVVVATKMGRREDMDPSVWTQEQFLSWLNRSRRNLAVDTIDLVQLHCIGPEPYAMESVWEALRELQSDDVVTAFGVSVETVDEALAALEVDGLATIQLIANLFRMRPVDEVFDAARDAGVGVIVRVPLASGLLTGKFDADSTFDADDHRNFNRDGQAFDVGETFAGVPWEVGLAAVERIRPLVPEYVTMAQFALRWVLDHDAVSVVIPGARTQAQARGNAAASHLDPLAPDVHAALREVYDEMVRPHVHDRW